MVRENKPIKVLMAKTALDSHSRGPIVVSQALRDAGMEVVFAGALRAEEVVQTAIQEDVDVIGLNVCGRYKQIKDMIALLKEKHVEDKLIIVGGTIPAEDIPVLKEMGVNEVFPPGSKMERIVQYVQSHAGKK
ncbi:MAG: cobalamin-dependent protein [Dehalococcoidia bacterium]|nr:cobalamin-dependent protein [Dehalococcoidia bacterium]